MERLTIGHLAQLGGVNLQTIRYYERRGLLPKPARTAAGYCQFAPEAARRLRFIKRAQELGFSLDEIGELLALGSQPRQNRATIRVRAQRKIEDIDRKVAALTAMKNTLHELVSQCEHCSPSAECPIVASLDEEGTT
jgi:MerR family mercuric resistance operon transcriptional regulator